MTTGTDVLAEFRAELVKLAACPECLGRLGGCEGWICDACGYDVAEEVIDGEPDS